MYVAIDGDKTENDPHQLYQHLLVAGVVTIDAQMLFQFDMRMADKADLQHDLVKRVPSCIATEYSTGVRYAINGASRLHHLPWPKSCT